MTRVSRFVVMLALGACGRSDPPPPTPPPAPAMPAMPTTIDVPKAVALATKVPLLPRTPLALVVDAQIGEEQSLTGGGQELRAVFDGEEMEALRPRFRKDAWCSVAIALRYHDPQYAVVSRAPSTAPVTVAALNADVAPGEHEVDVVATVQAVHVCHECPDGAMCKKCYESFTLAEVPGVTIDAGVEGLAAGMRIAARLRVTVERATAEVRGPCR